MKILIDEVKEVKIYKSNYQNFDSIILDNETTLEIGYEGIKELVHNLMFRFYKAYGEGELVTILQDQDFNDVRDELIETEVSELDTEIRLLREEVKELKSDLLNEKNLTRSYEDVRD